MNSRSENSENVNCNEAKSFLDYVQAIKRISVQFEQWEKKQEELKIYQRQYDTAAELLLKSIGLKLLDEILEKENSETLPNSSKTQQILNEGGSLINDLESSRKSKIEEKAKLESSLKGLLTKLNNKRILLQEISSFLANIHEYCQDQFEEIEAQIKKSEIQDMLRFLLLALLVLIGFSAFGWVGVIIAIIGWARLPDDKLSPSDTKDPHEKLNNILESRKQRQNIFEKKTNR